MGSVGSSFPPEDHKNATSWPVRNAEGHSQAYKNDGRWVNWWARDKPSPLSIMSKFAFSKDNSKIPSSQYELNQFLPVNKPYWLENDNTSIGEPGIRATWIGHATVLAEVDSTLILTDPIFSQRASAVQWAGPKRYRPPACNVQQLPQDLKAVVISHTHYDHLDYNSAKDLNTKYGTKLHWFVPQDMGSWFKDNFNLGDENLHELTWWQEKMVPGTSTSIALTPSNHWGRRTAFDENKALWGSYAVLGPKHKFWFGGDTAYCEGFKEIGEKFGPFDLAAIPIGAYEPREIMVYHHVNPEEAVKIHEDIKSKMSFGIHWATFKLTFEPYMAPKSSIEEICRTKNLSNFKVINLGDKIETKE